MGVSMRAIGLGLAAATCGLVGGGTAAAQSCTTYPYSFSTGTVAYAAQVNANFACAVLTGKGLFTGNVGIGTTTPQNTLHVNGGITTTSGGPDAATTPALSLYDSGSTGYITSLANEVAWEPLVIAAGTISIMSDYSIQGFYQNASGSVGIGTTTPADTLDVTAPVVFGNATERLSLNSGSIGFNRRVATGQIYNTSAYAYQWQHIPSSTATSDWLQLQVYSPSGGTVTGAAIAVNGQGGVAVGGGALDGWLFTSNGYAGGTESWATTSDTRLKTNITPITGALAAVLQLQGVRYSFITAESRTLAQDLKLPNTPQVGFLAQDVAKVVPEAVVAPADPTTGVYGLMESKLVPYLVEAIKAQQAQIATQQTAMATQQTEIATLQSQVATLRGTH